jgi:hypothetical protein
MCDDQPEIQQGPKHKEPTHDKRSRRKASQSSPSWQCAAESQAVLQHTSSQALISHGAPQLNVNRHAHQSIKTTMIQSKPRINLLLFLL